MGGDRASGRGSGGGAGGTLSQAQSALRLRSRRVDKPVSVKSTSSSTAVRRSRSHMELRPPSQQSQAAAVNVGPYGAGGTGSSGRCVPTPPTIASTCGISPNGGGARGGANANARHCASVSMQSRQRDETDGRHLPRIS